MTKKRISILNEFTAASAPAVNKRLSPGRNGVTTTPVSKNMIKNNRIYVIMEYSFTIICKYLSK